MTLLSTEAQQQAAGVTAEAERRLQEGQAKSIGGAVEQALTAFGISTLTLPGQEATPSTPTTPAPTRTGLTTTDIKTSTLLGRENGFVRAVAPDGRTFTVSEEVWDKHNK